MRVCTERNTRILRDRFEPAWRQATWSSAGQATRLDTGTRGRCSLQFEGCPEGELLPSPSNCLFPHEAFD